MKTSCHDFFMHEIIPSTIVVHEKGESTIIFQGFQIIRSDLLLAAASGPKRTEHTREPRLLSCINHSIAELRLTNWFIESSQSRHDTCV